MNQIKIIILFLHFVKRKPVFLTMFPGSCLIDYEKQFLFAEVVHLLGVGISL
jgi:hypothetical protein